MSDGAALPGRPRTGGHVPPAALSVTLLRSRRHVDFCRTATAICPALRTAPVIHSVA